MCRSSKMERVVEDYETELKNARNQMDEHRQAKDTEKEK
jgi:hypothetical protein